MIDEPVVTITLPQRVWQQVEYLLSSHVDEQPEFREAWLALRGEDAPSVEVERQWILDQLKAAAETGHTLDTETARTAEVLDFGMEDRRSAYIVLRLRGEIYFLIERRNDDGEFSALLYPGRGASREDYLRAIDRIGEYADELNHAQLAALEIIVADHESWEVNQLLDEILFGLRDHIAPDALKD
jgi:hypothetical protein